MALLLAGAALLLASSCADVVPPAVEVAPLADTRDELGPYTVTAQVVEHREINEVRLYHRDENAERAEIVLMEEILPGRFEAGIPGRMAGTSVHWFLEAEDIYGNLGYAPAEAEWGDEVCVDTLPEDEGVPEGGAAYCFSVLR